MTNMIATFSKTFSKTRRWLLFAWCLCSVTACSESGMDESEPFAQPDPIMGNPTAGSPSSEPNPSQQAQPAPTPAGQQEPTPQDPDAPVDNEPTEPDAPMDDEPDNEAPVPDVPVEEGPVDFGAPGPYEIVVDKNVGEAFRNNVADDTSRCRSFLALAGASPEITEQLTSYPDDMDRELYTLFRPATLQEGKRYPAITWGNGTCSHPLLFEELLEHLASHGFLIIATNTRWTGGGVEMLRAIDFMLSEDENPDSPLFGKVDTEMLGAAGHSQGSGATVTVGADPRIVATVPIQGASASGVAQLNGPTFLIAGELDDLVAPSSVVSAFNAATVPAVYGLSKGQDHLMPGQDPTPILDAVTAWFKIHLEDDEQARELFYGDSCTLCSDARWELMRDNL